ncbi:hypothetical protein BJ138DRAFT_1018219 [Hygrophoropsis aurantiaca]|uniref:Uncharacterized protein n=1 Tax=Hygrophoropsis aurantiaca TaxID=72124 RepID=A0ACB7ZV57_9AGAM|nr:hypothetical protein BJ138DRAFT_1018219 [Hygrophoropsis aurantiaca]
MPHPNQHKPCPPEKDIKESAEFYYQLGLNDKEIVKQLQDHYDTEIYGLSVVSFRRLRKRFGWLRARQQKHTLSSIEEHVLKIRKRFPQRGANTIRHDLRVQFGMQVPRPLISRLLKIAEPDAVQARRRRRFKRKRFWSAGVNDVWPQDQHDKWGRFGLWLHISLDPYSGYINWLKVWWTNKNPRLIARYYIEACRKLGAVPLVTQSDPGSENFSVANAHTTIRHRLDSSLSDTLQHRWMRKHQNIKPEIQWSVFRRNFAPGFEDILDEGVNEGLYDVNDTLENYVFRWLAIPWIQAELDQWVHHRNHNPPRADKNKILPHGIPAIIRAKPHQFDSLDFKIPVPAELLDEVEEKYAPSDHPVFDLVPPLFDQRANELYQAIGAPLVSSDNFWGVYQQLLSQFRSTTTGCDPQMETLLRSSSEPDEDDPNEIAILPDLKDLRLGANVVGPKGFQYLGGMKNPPTQGLRGVKEWVAQAEETEPGESDPEVANFTTDEEGSDEEDSGEEGP